MSPVAPLDFTKIFKMIEDRWGKTGRYIASALLALAAIAIAVSLGRLIIGDIVRPIIPRRELAVIAGRSIQPDSTGGPGGAGIASNGGFAIAGPGGRGGVPGGARGGAGGPGIAIGKGSIACGGEGGEGSQPNGAGGQGGRPGCYDILKAELAKLGIKLDPNAGRGGNGGNGVNAGPSIPPRGPDCFRQWGVMSPPPASGPELYVVADGLCVLRSLKINRNDYYMSAVAFHAYGLRDLYAEPLMVKGEPHDIQPSTIIMMREGADFLHQPPNPNSQPLGRAYYALVVVPRKIAMDQFSTLDEGATLGVLLAGIDTGPQ